MMMKKNPAFVITVFPFILSGNKASMSTCRARDLVKVHMVWCGCSKSWSVYIGPFV